MSFYATVTDLLNTEPWMADAVCATSGDPDHVRHWADTWHPDTGRSATIERQRHRSIAALRVCNGTKVGGQVTVQPCPVREQCLAYALGLTKGGQRVEGGFGGTVEAERMRLLGRGVA